MTILADGKLMFKDGIYVKPSSGTGAGTLVINSSRNFFAASSLKVSAVAPQNIAPSTDEIEVSGYGIIGNRGTFYITNSGNVQLGTGSVHNGSPALTAAETSVNVGASRTFKMNGTTVINASREIDNVPRIFFNGGLQAIDLNNSDSLIFDTPDGHSALLLSGGSYDTNYHSNETHFFRGTDLLDFHAQIDTSGIKSFGDYKVASTTVIDASRNLTNIGTITSTAVNQANAQKITVSDTDPLTSRNGLLIDHNVSGNTALTADITKRGILVDMDVTSTGGTTSNEIRAYGIHSDVRGTGDSDLRYAIYGYAETQHSSGTVTSNIGVFGYGVADDTSSGHTANNYGGSFLATGSNSGSGGTTHHYGSYSKVLLNTANDKNTASATGVYAEIEVDNPGQAQTLSTAYVVRAEFDNDSAGNVTINNSYLYYGNYASTLPTNAWGVYIVDAVPNYFAGTISSGAITSTGTTKISGSHSSTITTPNINSFGALSAGTAYNYHIMFKQADGTVRGQITNNIYGTQYTTSSDYRLKENVQPLSSSTSRTLALNPCTFEWIDDADNNSIEGFLAHEVAAIVPEAVVGTKDALDADGNPEYQTIDQSKLIPILVKTIQELEARITALESA